MVSEGKNKVVYVSTSVSLEKEMGIIFDEYCRDQGTTRSQEMRKLIRNSLVEAGYIARKR